MGPSRKGLSVKRFPERMQEMLDSKLVDRLRLARGALVLVSEGKSERSAVSRIASSDPQLRHEKSSALALVIDVVSTLDLLDRTVQTTFPGSEFDKRSIALFRLAALKILSSPARPRYVRVNPLRNRGRVSLPLELRKYSDQLVEPDSGIHLLTGSPSILAKYFEKGLF